MPFDLMIENHMNIEYVTDPVLLLKLRCPQCRSKVRQMREELPASLGLSIIFSGEPLAWLVVGIGAVVGYATEAIWAFVLTWAILGPPVMVWIYLSRLRKSEFLCSTCGARTDYAGARRCARVGH